MKSKVTNDMGDILISLDVISAIAGAAAVSCSGVIGMASVNLADGLVRLLRKDSLRKGIVVNITDDGSVTLKAHIIVAYGVNIYTVADNLIETVKYQVEEHTGLRIAGIEVYVEGVRRID